MEGGRKKKHAAGEKRNIYIYKKQKVEKYHLPEPSWTIICSRHNDLQYAGERNGSHFKITA